MFRLLARLKGSWLRILLLAALTLAGVYSDLYLPSLMARIINDGITGGDQRLILLTGMEMLLFALLGVLCAVSSGILSSQVSMGFGRDLRGAVFRKTAALSLTELEDCVSGGDTTGEEVDLHLLAEAMERYLRGLSPDARTVFLGRYWFLDPLRDIAASHGFTEGKVKSLLYRTRQGLRAHLEKEGFTV